MPLIPLLLDPTHAPCSAASKCHRGSRHGSLLARAEQAVSPPARPAGDSTDKTFSLLERWGNESIREASPRWPASTAPLRLNEAAAAAV